MKTPHSYFIEVIEFKIDKRKFRAAFRKACEQGCVANGVPKSKWRQYLPAVTEFFGGK